MPQFDTAIEAMSGDIPDQARLQQQLVAIAAGFLGSGLLNSASTHLMERCSTGLTAAHRAHDTPCQRLSLHCPQAVMYKEINLLEFALKHQQVLPSAPGLLL